MRARLEKLTQHILERPLFHVLDAALEGMLGRLQMGDRLLVSELSRLGRSLGQVIGRPKGALGKATASNHLLILLRIFDSTRMGEPG